jgi:hypothetical protein
MSPACVIEEVKMNYSTDKQAAANITKVYIGLRDTNAIPITVPYHQVGIWGLRTIQLESMMRMVGDPLTIMNIAKDSNEVNTMRMMRNLPCTMNGDIASVCKLIRPMKSPLASFCCRNVQHSMAVPNALL